MALVTVRMYATLRDASGVDELQVEASNMAELLDALSQRSEPGLGELLQLYGPQEGSIVILLNGKNVTSSDLRSLRLSRGDDVSIFPPISGG
jgi:MoaD family protein